MADSHHTTQPQETEEEHQEASPYAMHSREVNAREAMDADSLTVLRRVAVEDSPVDTTQLPVERPALAMHSREESVREVTDAVTTTVRRVLEIPQQATTVAVTGLVVCASPSRRESVSVERPADSPTRRLSLPVTTHLIKRALTIPPLPQISTTLLPFLIMIIGTRTAD